MAPAHWGSRVSGLVFTSMDVFAWGLWLPSFGVVVKSNEICGCLRLRFVVALVGGCGYIEQKLWTSLQGFVVALVRGLWFYVTKAVTVFAIGGCGE